MHEPDREAPQVSNFRNSRRLTGRISETSGSIQPMQCSGRKARALRGDVAQAQTQCAVKRSEYGLSSRLSGMYFARRHGASHTWTAVQSELSATDDNQISQTASGQSLAGCGAFQPSCRSAHPPSFRSTESLWTGPRKTRPDRT